jgi:hypothetical protein
MEFEFDSAKSAANREKHGIDFLGAQAIWRDEQHLVTPARSLTEPRFQILGLIDGKLWSVFVTYRGEKIRLISVRRARPEEEKRYYEN